MNFPPVQSAVDNSRSLLRVAPVQTNITVYIDAEQSRKRARTCAGNVRIRERGNRLFLLLFHDGYQVRIITISR